MTMCWLFFAVMFVGFVVAVVILSTEGNQKNNAKVSVSSLNKSLKHDMENMDNIENETNGGDKEMSNSQNSQNRDIANSTPKFKICDEFNIGDDELKIVSSISLYKDQVLVGFPKDSRYGKVCSFQNIDDKTRPVSTFQFSISGSVDQMAGFAINVNLVAAPNFTNQKKEREGTLFQIQENEIRRLKVYLKDGFVMRTTGDIFAYTHPFVYVSKIKEKLARVDIFKFENEALKFQKSIMPVCEGGSFGHFIQTSSNVVIVGDSFWRFVYIFINYNLMQTIENAGWFKLSGNGKVLLVALDGDGAIAVYRQVEHGSTTTYRNVFNIPMENEANISISEDGVWCCLGNKVYCLRDIAQLWQTFNFPITSMTTWKNQELIVVTSGVLQWHKTTIL